MGKRKSIVLDTSAIKRVEEQHHDTAGKLSEYFQEEESAPLSAVYLLPLNDFKYKCMFTWTIGRRNYAYFFSLLYFIFLFSCKNNTGQNLALRKKEIAETRSLLKHYFIHELKLKTVFLAEVPAQLKSKYCIEEIIAGHKSFNLTGQYVIDKSQKDSTLWTPAISGEFKILSTVQVKKLESINESNHLIKMGGIYMISRPIFSKDFKFAIIESIRFCGSRCGTAETLLFESEKGTWTLVEKYCPVVF